MPKEVKKFPAQLLIEWQKECGRNNLPWQATHDPYLRWVAETMLQQTQVETVKSYYEKFTARFPTLDDLANATEDEVLVEWEGLGYYSRARNLLKCARTIVKEQGGIFPMTVSALEKLPGIGPSTAGAIVSAVTDKPEPIFDGNVKRAFSRFFAINETYGSTQFSKEVLKHAQDSLPQKEGRAYAQGLMDLGSMICARSAPKCLMCPVSSGCKAFNLGQVSKYPIKAPRKIKPIKEMYWLIGLNKGKVFLERRQGKGIWKGLWSFPMTTKSPKTFLKEIPPIQHEFTHFTLIAKPFIVPLTVIDSYNGDWFDRNESQKIGVPSPVRPLLRQLFMELES